MKLLATLLSALVLVGCKSPPQVNPADYIVCYYSNSSGLPYVKITASSFQVPELHYSDIGIRFERIKVRNLISLSSPYSLENNDSKLRSADLTNYTNATA